MSKINFIRAFINLHPNLKFLPNLNLPNLNLLRQSNFVTIFAPNFEQLFHRHQIQMIKYQIHRAVSIAY